MEETTAIEERWVMPALVCIIQRMVVGQNFASLDLLANVLKKSTIMESCLFSNMSSPWCEALLL